MHDVSQRPEEVIALAKAYMQRSGMHPADFARRVGYNYSTILRFLSNTYARGEQNRRAALCRAIVEFIEKNPAEAPDDFHGKLYEIGNVRVLRDLFTRLCAEPCILLAYAPPGSGKTDVARALIPQFRGDVPVVRVYCREHITRRDLMQRIAEKCGSVIDASIERTIRNLRFDFKGRRIALYFDESQHLSVECLETVRELYDELGWSLCFAGSHQLDRIFTEWAGDLEQLERRITDKVYVPSVSREEAEQIVHSELPGFDKVKARTLIESSHVQLKKGEPYLSIGRVMANIKAIQKRMPDADSVVQSIASEEIA